ncbi:hypothetical protein Tco_1291749 [Tanacetum coccineum]
MHLNQPLNFSSKDRLSAGGILFNSILHKPLVIVSEPSSSVISTHEELRTLLTPLNIYSRSFSSDREVKENFRDYTKMTAQTFKETIIQNMNSIEQYSHARSRGSIIVTSSGEETSSGIVSEEEIEKKDWKHIYVSCKDSGRSYYQNPSSTDTPLEQNKHNEFEKYKAFNDQTIDYEILQTKLNETLGLLTLKDIEIKEDLPNGERTVTSEQESRSKLDKDKVKPYDYTYQNSLYETFKPPSKTYLDQLERAKRFTCSYLHSLSDLNANTELQCLYLHKVKECECLALKLSKQTESVNNEVHNKLLKSFAKLEKHSISLELSLQHCKEQMKNNSVCKENGSNVFRKEREQYHEIQDLKAQMQDKNIAISKLKKLIEKCKGKSVETQFDKPSVVRQPNAQRITKPSVLGKPTPFSNSPEMRSFQTKQSVNKTNVSDGLFKQVTQQNLPQIRKQAVRNTNLIAPGPSRNCPKHVSHQSPREKVGSNDMVHNYYLEKAKKSAQLMKNWQASMSSQVSNKDVHLGEHRKQKPFLKFNDLQCPTCKKCLYSANHDECVLEYLLRPRSSMFKRRLIAADQASVFMAMTSVHISSGLVLHQMTSDHNRSELGIQDHSNEPSSSKLVPKVVPLAVKTATSRQELELLFHHHIAMLRTTGK